MVGFAILVMLVDIFNRGADDVTRALAALAGLARRGGDGGICYLAAGPAGHHLPGQAIADRFALGIDFVVLVAAGLAILLSVKYIPDVNRQTGEYYALLLLVACRHDVHGRGDGPDRRLPGAGDLLAGALHPQRAQPERPAQQRSRDEVLPVGRLCQRILCLRRALLYGATGGHAVRRRSRQRWPTAQATSNLLYPGIALLIVGFGFKVSLVPFHMWTPDVYQGAPTPVTAFMSVATKAAAFAAFYRTLPACAADRSRQSGAWRWRFWPC